MNELTMAVIRLIEVLEKAEFYTEHGDRCELASDDRKAFERIRISLEQQVNGD